ncbi:MAG: glycosyltransferase family 2 protein [Pseudomonadota bacterium]
MSNDDIAVIVVNYGTASLAIAAVESVLARTHGGRSIEVHLVDNASPGDDVQKLKEWWRDCARGHLVTLHLETENHGFGRGNNVVLQQLEARDTPPSMVMFLNPDATLENEAIDILAQTLETNDKAVMAGAGIRKPDGTPVSAAFRFPSAASEFCGAINFGPVARLFKQHEVPLPPDHPGGQVDWVAGAAVLARFDALKAQNFFDPDFFLYFEEVELMHRLQKADGQILYVPEARVVHAEGAATGVKSGRRERKRQPAYWYDSWQLYFRKTHGWKSARRIARLRLLGAYLGYPLAWLRGRAPGLPLNFLKDFQTHALKPLLRNMSSR